MENLAPSELKKIRNKQRKQRAKEDLERKQAQEKMEKKELHNKSRQQVAGDAEPDAPKQDELIPEKLTRAEDPLEQAIKFLQPLQTLASDRIQTHLMAFEIYYRKGKALLMLQSIRRAHKVEPDHPLLHTCIIRYKLYLDVHVARMEESITTVINETMKPIWGEKDAKTLNAEYLKAHKHSIRHVLQGTRMLYYLEPQQQKIAVSLATCLDEGVEGVSIEVPETCTDVLDALKNGDFGSCSKEAEEFRVKCQEKYPLALAFKEGGAAAAAAAAVASSTPVFNHVSPTGQEN
ncbi:hypothetical protein RUM43_006552 [Polyplax serrata]|uniref:Uncharacterized protein n=1 Tax=Polyplax serrata TaxID=468196 RepID=A0AAN8S3S9_POLSC